MQLSVTPSPFNGTQLCVSVGPDIFFPEDYEDLQAVDAAKAICNDCHMQELCLQFALSNNEKEGIWGGTTPIERRRIRRRVKK
jgi:WhiB family redox-sensing transcriptional regulator